MTLAFAGLGGLFFAAFIASTLFPASSEAVLAGVLAGGAYDPWLLISVATVGNVLGASVKIGLWGRWAAETRWVQGQNVERAARLFRRYGAWSLLFSWLPLVGDPLTLAAGLARLGFIAFVLPVAAGKIGRYLAVFYLADWISKP